MASSSAVGGVVMWWCDDDDNCLQSYNHINADAMQTSQLSLGDWIFGNNIEIFE